MDMKLLAKVMSEAGKAPKSTGGPCKSGDTRSKCRRKWNSVFPVLHPSKMGTPYTYRPGSANVSLGLPDSSVPAPAPAAEGIRPSKLKVLHEMRRSMGLVEYFANHSWSSSPNPSWGGYSVPSFGSVAMRKGGPTIGGPGFYSDPEFKGGVYDLKKSPGLAFRTEYAWRIWDKALEIMAMNKTMPKHSVLLNAMSKSGIHRGQMDPSELRLLEMGIEWYLSDQGSLAAKRDGSPIP